MYSGKSLPAGKSQKALEKRLAENIPEELLDLFPGVDVVAGIKYMGGKRDLYATVLKEFHKDHKDAPELLAKAIERGDRDLIYRIAHTIKGLAANIGAKDLKTVAGKIEVASARAGSIPTQSDLDEFTICLNEFFTISEKIQATFARAISYSEAAGNLTVEKKHKILIVDDDRTNIDILVDALGPEYETYVAQNGRQALIQVASNPPDLILMDVLMPEMNGFEACRKLKSEAQTKDIPVIFISAMKETDDEYIGLENGAIDYLVKPFHPKIVRARVKNHLKLRNSMLDLERLNKLALDANPNTGLPGNNSVAKAVSDAILNRDPVCVVYVDLDYFKAFNDKYGFARGDDVIRFAADLLTRAPVGFGCQNTFVGHIGGDDFLLIVDADKCRPVCESVISRFDESIGNFYDAVDAKAKCLLSLNRKGEQVEYPLISISMAGVDLTLGAFSQYLEVNDACAEVKKKAKAIPGSSFYIDMRRTE
jgi:CheY-like chemotaxis protein/HPt (histidine-containing phosphotransfer) domain-containing protein